MDLTSDHPFWAVQNGLLTTYPPLVEDRVCDVAVVGAGVTGAMIAHRLSGLGLGTIVLDGRDACCGSTSASTGLLQYEVDVPLVRMSELIGPAAAERAYLLSYRAIDSIEELAASIPDDCGFRRKTSIYLAKEESAANLLRAEAEARRHCGIDVRLLESNQLEEEFSISGYAALVSTQAATCDPHRLAHGLLTVAVKSGCEVFDRTRVETFDWNDSGVTLRTNRGFSVAARNVVIATGYEALTMLKEKVAKLKSTYAVISQPLPSLHPWHQDWILWEASDPYLYLRSTPDRRLLVGGEDDGFRNPRRRDARIAAKSNRLRQKVQQLLPDLSWEIEYAWAGTFGETRDGLAYIGQTPQFPHCHFALGFGGNGITFSALAADLIAAALTGAAFTGAALTGADSEDARLFRFGR